MGGEVEGCQGGYTGNRRMWLLWKQGSIRGSEGADLQVEGAPDCCVNSWEAQTKRHTETESWLGSTGQTRGAVSRGGETWWPWHWMDFPSRAAGCEGVCDFLKRGRKSRVAVIGFGGLRGEIGNQKFHFICHLQDIYWIFSGEVREGSAQGSA